MPTLLDRFQALLVEASAELHADHPAMMSSPDLLPTPNVIDEGDVELFFWGVEADLIRVTRGGKFNTFDRPKAGGRWSLLSRSKDGGWYNAEYLPQLAAYVDLIQNLGYPKERVLFELPGESLQLDLAVLDDAERIVVLGEAKRDTRMLPRLLEAVGSRFAEGAPDEESKKRGDEARQLAWRLWHIQPDFCWLVAPGMRVAYQCESSPLRLSALGHLPKAAEIGLDHRPGGPLRPPRLV